MANIKINNVTYQGVPSVTVPKADNTGNAIFYDTAEATGTPANTPSGVIAFNANGKYMGQATFPAVSQDSTTKILSIS